MMPEMVSARRKPYRHARGNVFHTRRAGRAGARSYPETRGKVFHTCNAGRAGERPKALACCNHAHQFSPLATRRDRGRDQVRLGNENRSFERRAKDFEEISISWLVSPSSQSFSNRNRTRPRTRPRFFSSQGRAAWLQQVSAYGIGR